MRVPFVSFIPMEKELDTEIRAAFDRVLSNSWYIDGEEDKAFEKAFSDYVGTDYCVGVGNGYLKQVAASESDLVFGLLAEEMGIIVAITIALSVAMLVIYTRAITTRSRSTFYSISAGCAAGLLVVQLSLNVFGATDILPLTGVTFPFISCGGSSIMSVWGLLAFIKAADERTYSLKR